MLAQGLPDNARLSPHRYSLRTPTGFYLTAENNGGRTAPAAMSADRRQRGPWETFQLISFPDRTIALRTEAGYYLTAEAAGAGGLATDRTQIGPWERFHIRRVPGEPLVTLQTVSGSYVTAERGGGMTGTGAVATDRTVAGPWEKFHLEVIRADTAAERPPAAAAPPPATLSLLNPANHALMDNGCMNQTNGIDWDFTWSGLPGASAYQLVVMGARAVNPAVNVTIPGTSYQHRRQAYIVGANQQGWVWKVRAQVNGEWGAWVERSFDVESVDTDCR